MNARFLSFLKSRGRFFSFSGSIRIEPFAWEICRFRHGPPQVAPPQVDLGEYLARSLVRSLVAHSPLALIRSLRLVRSLARYPPPQNQYARPRSVS